MDPGSRDPISTSIGYSHPPQCESIVAQAASLVTGSQETKKHTFKSIKSVELSQFFSKYQSVSFLPGTYLSSNMLSSPLNLWEITS